MLSHLFTKYQRPLLAIAACFLILRPSQVDLMAQAAYTVNYTYDDQGRVTSATYNDETAIRYTYDAIGNLTSRVIEPVGPTYSEEELGLPTRFALHASYPNPFNPTTTISYDVKTAVDVNLVIYDTLGRQVTNVVDAFRVPGRYQEAFDGRALSSGLYFYEIKMGDFRDTKSMMLIK